MQSKLALLRGQRKLREKSWLDSHKAISSKARSKRQVCLPQVQTNLGRLTTFQRSTISGSSLKTTMRAPQSLPSYLPRPTIYLQKFPWPQTRVIMKLGQGLAGRLSKSNRRAKYQWRRQKELQKPPRPLFSLVSSAIGSALVNLSVTFHRLATRKMRSETSSR